MNLKFEEFKKSNPSLLELDKIREKNFKKFQEEGFPTKKEEQWKYTDLKTIINNNFINLQIIKNSKNSKYEKNSLLKNFEHNKIIMLNGNFIDTDFNFEDKKKVSIKSLNAALKEKKDFEKLKNYFNNEKNSMNSLNNALVNDGIVLKIENDYSFKKPLIIYNFFDKLSENKIINNKVIILLGSRSQLSFVDYYNSEDNVKYFHNSIHNYVINDKGVLKKFNINSILDNSYSYNTTIVDSYSNSLFENFLLSLSPNFIKSEIQCNLLEHFSSCFLNAVMLLNAHQHHELKTNVNHNFENCKSSQLVKSVLLDKSSGTYQGKIFVDKRAQKTNGYQLSKALILSEKSEFNSKPELEIYADDVKCSHGSTTGNIDENSLFYLMSRGLTRDQANKMIVEGFLNEVIETITEPVIKPLISKVFNEKINQIRL